ncbi:SirB1 family protein [Mastigocoleus testarum]|uniref:Protein SirB1 N-terminal domain-containing protein n=1 Tax=Mastigocoleus testarum BC008 TaxID=371196 RepID=A0A0V7ZQY5_9CYAN|nr:tetratricopeptide repeat protein [Mastigocoleus testarum]KST66511.1 hypothetical protein BC008_43045 [Mastigocoleus testarum BC008]
MNLSSVRQKFYQETQKPDEDIDLARASLYIAQEEYPEIDPEVYIQTLDGMAQELSKRLPENKYPLVIIQNINQYLYDDLGFNGNNSDYYDTQNSFLNKVIERRLGIPISLSLIYLEIARRINFPMVGVGMPGHFLIRPEIEEIEIFVDTFNRGEVIFTQDCQDRLNQIYQKNIVFKPEYLAAVTKKKFLARILDNLKIIYVHQQEIEKALGAVERKLLLFPDAHIELRDRGLLLFQLGYFPQAIRDLETYLEIEPNSEDVSTIRSLLSQLRKNIDN